jgi:UDP-N-acetylglucosamine acyltransferase
MSATIHPLAVIAPGAVIGDGCTIGPFCCIGPDVRLGPGCHLHEHVVVDGHTTVGAACQFFSFACIGKQTQDLKWQGGTAYVEIGSRTTLREYVTVHASSFDGGKTVVGADCSILAYSHIAHDCLIGDHVVMSNGCQIAGHVTVEDHVVFGGLAGVVQFARIGRLAMVGAMAKAVQDITPFTLVEGAPAEPRIINKIGMERAGLSAAAIQAIHKTFKIFFRSGLPVADALAKIEAEFPGVPEVAQFVAFVRTAKRGVARPSVAVAAPVPAA